MPQSSALQLDTWTRELAHTFREGYQPIGVISCEPTGPAPIRVDFHNAIFAALTELPGSTPPDPDEALRIMSDRLRQIVKGGATPLAVMLTHTRHPTLSICYCRSGLRQSGVNSGEVSRVATRAYHAFAQELRESLTALDHTKASKRMAGSTRTPTTIH